jgi:hypothetical protein
MTQRFVEQLESRRRQRKQRRPLNLFKHFADLLARRAMNASVGDAALPPLQVVILLSLRSKRATFERVVFNVADAALDLAFVPRRVRARRKNRDAVMPAERLNFGIELRIEPVGLRHGRAQVVDDQRPRHAAEVSKGVLDRTQEVIGRLTADDFAVAFAAVRKNDAEHPRSPTLSFSSDHRRAPAEVHLRFGRRLAFHPPKRRRRGAGEFADQPADAVVTAGVSVFADQILVNPLGGQTLVELVDNDASPSRRGTGRAGPSRACRAGGRVTGRFWRGLPEGRITGRIQSLGAEGRAGRF